MKVLTIICNRIESIVTIVRNTLLQDIKTYARLCVEVNLFKPLLVMFSIKGRTYKVKYEWLHLLCLKCGKFGHYVIGCREKPSTIEDNVGRGGDKDGGDYQTKLSGVQVTKPWKVVSKSR